MALIVTRGSSLQDSMLELALAFAKAASIETFDSLRRYDAKRHTERQEEEVASYVTWHKCSFGEAWATCFVRDKYGSSTTHWSQLLQRLDRWLGKPLSAHRRRTVALSRGASSRVAIRGVFPGRKSQGYTCRWEGAAAPGRGSHRIRWAAPGGWRAAGHFLWWRRAAAVPSARRQSAGDNRGCRAGNADAANYVAHRHGCARKEQLGSASCAGRRRGRGKIRGKSAKRTRKVPGEYAAPSTH